MENQGRQNTDEQVHYNTGSSIPILEHFSASGLICCCAETTKPWQLTKESAEFGDYRVKRLVRNPWQSKKQGGSNS